MKKAKYFHNKTKVNKSNIIFKNLFDQFILKKNNIKHLFNFMDCQIKDI